MVLSPAGSLAARFAYRPHVMRRMRRRTGILKGNSMRKFNSILSGAVVAFALSLSPAIAGPIGQLGPAATTAAEESSLVTKVHGFHRYCAEGRFGYHRHVPGGVVACGPSFRGPPVYAPPPPPAYHPPTYRSRRADYCAMIYNQCIAQFPRHSPPYHACMQRERC